MITAFIFFLHIIFMLVIFTKKWQEDGLSSGFINLGLIGVLFAVGWTLSGTIAKLVMEQKGFGIYYDRDTFSLTLLTVAEYFFYRFYYKDTPTATDKEIQ